MKPALVTVLAVGLHVCTCSMTAQEQLRMLVAVKSVETIQGLMEQAHIVRDKSCMQQILLSVVHSH